MWEGGMRQKDMKLVCVEGVLEAVGDLGVEQDLERDRPEDGKAYGEQSGHPLFGM